MVLASVIALPRFSPRSLSSSVSSRGARRRRRLRDERQVNLDLLHRRQHVACLLGADASFCSGLLDDGADLSQGKVGSGRAAAPTAPPTAYGEQGDHGQHQARQRRLLPGRRGDVVQNIRVTDRWIDGDVGVMFNNNDLIAPIGIASTDFGMYVICPDSRAGGPAMHAEDA
ncbi:MAG: hypothetical protein M3O70_26080 [Actinomycetota bacterium]|nr:hypothetical protein [Actinomycetota bacterium]